MFLFILSGHLHNGRCSHKQPPEGPSTEDPSTQESHPEATIKIKHLSREELNLMEETNFFGQRSLMAKQLLHGAKGRKTANTHPESAFAWVLIGWALGRSLPWVLVDHI